MLLQQLTSGTTQNYTFSDILMPKSRKTDAIRFMVLSTDNIEQLIELVHWADISEDLVQFVLRYSNITVESLRV